jgi:Fe-S oxidoreductase
MAKNIVSEKFEQCISCGACFRACEAYKTQNPKQLKKLAQTLKDNTLAVDDAHFAYRCNLCGYCQTKCPVGLNPSELFKEARISYCRSGQGPLSYHTPMLTNKKVNFFSLNNADALKKEDYPKEAETIFFPGCALRTFRPDLVAKVSGLLGKDVLTMNHECCGKSLKGIGLEDDYEAHNNSVLALLEGFRPKQIIVACPNCYTSFKPKIKFAEVLFAEELLLQKAAEIKPSVTANFGTVTIHDSCPFKETPELFDLSRGFVDAFYGGKRVEMENSRGKLLCCGGGGGVSFSNEKLSRRISQVRLQEAKAAGADTVVTFCLSCATQFGSVAAKEGVRVIHALDLLQPEVAPDYGAIYRRSRKQFGGGKLFVNLMRLSLQV